MYYNTVIINYLQVEMGMKNHEVVPVELVSIIAGINLSQCRKILIELVRHKLCCYEHRTGMLIVLGYEMYV